MQGAIPRTHAHHRAISHVHEHAHTMAVLQTAHKDVRIGHRRASSVRMRNSDAVTRLVFFFSSAHEFLNGHRSAPLHVDRRSAVAAHGAHGAASPAALDVKVIPASIALRDQHVLGQDLAAHGALQGDGHRVISRLE